MPQAPSHRKENSHPVEEIIRLEDCVKGMAKLQKASVDIVVTSPPYNLGIDYGTYMDTKEQADYLRWCVEWARAVRVVLKEKGSLFLNLGSCPKNPTIPHALIYEIVRDGQFVLQNTIHWIKAITVVDDAGNEFSRGHFKPINSDRFINDCHEFIFHLTPTGHTPVDRRAVGVAYKHKSNIARWGHTGGEDKRCRGNTWFIPYQTINSREKDRPHPATFPVELPERCIRLHGYRKDLVVMDPFLGIGSTWRAAIRCGVGKFIGFEIHKPYVQLAREYAGEETLAKRRDT